MSTQETGGGLSKWQIAALIGAPIAAACVLGALYYWRSSQSSEQKDPEKGEVDTTTSTSGVPKNEAPESEENMVCVRKIISQKNPCFSSPPLKWTLSWATYCFTPPSLNPLAPRDDELVTFLNDIHSLSSKRVMRISKLIRWKLLS